MKYAVVTFGCRVNQADSLGFEERLLAAGAVASSPESADVVIVNSCSVTATADQGTRQTIRRLARENPDAKIVVTGCYATRRPDEVAALPGVVRVVSNDDKPRLIPLITTIAAEHAEQNIVFAISASSAVQRRDGDERRGDDADGPCGASIALGVAGRTAFTLRVQTGCAEPCSYCIIPETRGAPRSVAIDDVLREVERVAAAGFKEIALTGVHLGSYGRDLTPRASLFDLLVRLTVDSTRDVGRVRPPASAPSDRARALARPGRSAEREGRQPDLQFRISSLEPMDCTPAIVDLVAESDRFAPHFHLPLQHASDAMLASMRRPYTIAQYAALVDRIRERMPHAAIGTDVIVGFPGETDDDFAQLADYLDRSPLTHVHVFPYSDRPGTAASRMGDRAPGNVVRERGRAVRDIGQRLAARFRESQIGTTHRALTLEDGTLVVTGNYLKLRIPPGCARNEWVDVRVASQHDGEMLRR